MTLIEALSLASLFFSISVVMFLLVRDYSKKSMEVKEEYRKEAEKYHINVVIAGHMASDSLAMNLFLDQLEKKGIKVVPCSGLIRIKRIKK